MLPSPPRPQIPPYAESGWLRRLLPSCNLLCIVCAAGHWHVGRCAAGSLSLRAAQLRHETPPRLLPRAHRAAAAARRRAARGARARHNARRAAAARRHTPRPRRAGAASAGAGTCAAARFRLPAAKSAEGDRNLIHKPSGTSRVHPQRKPG